MEQQLKRQSVKYFGPLGRILVLGTLIFLILFFYVGYPAHTLTQKSKEPIYVQATRGIVRLEHYEDIKREGKTHPRRVRKPDGTAFFVQSGQDLFIVTARHVVEQDYDLHATVSTLQRSTGRTLLYELKLPRARWVFHPNGGDESQHPVDVAAMKLPNTKAGGVLTFSYCPSSCREGLDNQLGFDPIPPMRIIVFGFPVNIGFELKHPRPMGRQGIVALMSDENFIRIQRKNTLKYLDKKTFLVEANMFPGNSGSPIIAFPALQLGGKVNLLGLIIASNDRLDYGVAEPVSRIREVITIAQNQSIDFSPWHLRPASDSSD